MQDQTASPSAARLDGSILRDELKRLRTLIPDSPSLNPILNVAFDLSRRLETGQIPYDELRALAGRIMDRACVHRARRLRERIGYVDQQTTLKDFTGFVEKTANDAGTLEAFAERWSRARTGIVLTAHPTFGLSDELYARMVEIAVSDPGSSDITIGLPHRPSGTITLQHEHKCAQDAIQNLRNAYEELLHGFFSVASQKFGAAAYKVRPKLSTFASWVGYDLDGRTDIAWSFSFKVRLMEKRAALTDVRERFLAFKHKAGEASDAAQRIQRQLTGKLDLAIAAVDEQLKAMEAAAADPKGLAAAANIMTRGDGYNITSVEPITTLLNQLMDAVEPPQLKRAIAALIGLVDATGLGASHIHLRINALQLNNAFRAYVHEPWTRDLTERQALARIVDMIKNSPRESVNFATLDLETATAIRQFALSAQIMKHVDKETPIRFLIAECESPATVLIAVFFAKLFGVEGIVDISPLFETPFGLENGTRIMERLLEEEAYRDYVKGRKRLSVQTGFSDAGRFIGQISATLAIERYYHGLAAAIDRTGLDVETLIFSTHGESMGRGAHPDDLHTRLHYVMSDEARRRFGKAKLPVKHETSFQGGDGYMFFGHRALTTRTLATIVMDGEIPQEDNDPFYSEQNLSLDFFLRLRAYQQALFAHDGYRAMLGAFGPNLLFKTGSRPVKRQGVHASDRGDPARMRAIPNNAILQQFGYIANVVAGLGAGVGADRDRFTKLARSSARMQTLLRMIAHGKKLSSLNAMGANATVFDPGFWASRASWGREEALEPAFRSLATFLLKGDRSGPIHQFAHHLRLDAIDLHAILEDQNLSGGKVPDEHRLELDLLQAIRLAMIMRIFILAAQLPRFTPQDGLSYEQVLEMALSLEVPEVVSIMRKAFPHEQKSGDVTAFDEVASYRPRGIDDYGRLETEIFKPMEEAYEFVREIGTGISHHFGAFG